MTLDEKRQLHNIIIEAILSHKDTFLINNIVEEVSKKVPMDKKKLLNQVIDAFHQLLETDFIVPRDNGNDDVGFSVTYPQ
jgi:hypothetical protein